MHNKLGAWLSALSSGATVSGLIEDGIMSHISIGIAIISGLLSITITCINWYRSAKADGKITLDEVEGLVDEVIPQVGKLGEEVKKKPKKEVK